MLEVVQAYDRAHIAELPADDAAALERKFTVARERFLDRRGWLKPHERMAVLRRLRISSGSSVTRLPCASRAKGASRTARAGGNGPGHRRHPRCSRAAFHLSSSSAIWTLSTLDISFWITHDPGSIGNSTFSA